MNTATRYTRILVGYLTIGVVFATALTGGHKPGVRDSSPHAGTPCSLLSFAKFTEHRCSLWPFRD